MGGGEGGELLGSLFAGWIQLQRCGVSRQRQEDWWGGRGCLDAKTALGMGLYHIGVHERLVIQLGRLRPK